MVLQITHPFNGTFSLCDAGTLTDHIGKEIDASEAIVWVGTGEVRPVLHYLDTKVRG